MDWIKDALPDDSQTLWLIVICVALALLNVYQFAKAHGLATKVKTLIELGYAPEGKVIIPAAVVVPAVTTSTIPPPPPPQDDSGWRPQSSTVIPPLPWEKS